MTEEITMKEYAELTKRPQYFNFFLESCEMLSMFKNESAGKIIHAIADYFIDGETSAELPNFSKEERRCYNRIKQNVDDSCKVWSDRIEKAKKGANARWNKDD